MKAEEFYLDEYKGVFYSGDGEFEKAVFRFAEAYAEQENKQLREYAQHKPECTFGKTKYYNNKVCKVGEERSKRITKCTCGLEQALKK